jgi:hypothetical protein
VACPRLLVVVGMTGHPDKHPLTPGQIGLFGGPGHEPDLPTKPAPGAVSRIESNNVELMHTIAGNADRAGYLLAGPAERVYARDPDRNGCGVRVPRWEEDAVHQLLRRRWLYRGSTYPFSCGAADLTGTSVHTTRDTRTRVARWEQINRAPRPPSQAQPRRNGGDVVDLEQHRRTR